MIRRGLDTLAALAVLGASIAVIVTLVGQPKARSAQTGRPPVSTISLEGLPTLGVGPAVLIEFADFQCPFCVRFAKQTVPAIKERYVDTGKATIVFVNVPLDDIHPQASVAAAAALCLGRSGRFWDAHDVLFGLSKIIGPDEVWAALSPIYGRDTASLADCAERALPELQRQKQLASELGIRTTPTFLVGTRGAAGSVSLSRMIRGARPLSVFEAALDDAAGRAAK